MKYRKGDFVLVKSREWYDSQLKDYKNNVYFGFIHPLNIQSTSIRRIKSYCGEIVEIRKVTNDCYFVNYHGKQLKFPWYDIMFDHKI